MLMVDGNGIPLSTFTLAANHAVEGDGYTLW